MTSSGAAQRMREADPVRVQEHPLEPLARERLVPREVAVLVVAGEREAEVRQMDADLVGASGVELGVEQADRRIGVRPAVQPPKHGSREAACGVDPDAALAVAGHVGRQRQLDLAHRVAPFAPHEHRIALVDRAVAQLRVQAHEREALLCDQQHAGRVAIEPMDELEERRRRARAADALDDAERDAAAAVDGEPSRLVERDQCVVLEQNRRQCSARCGRRRPAATRRRRADRWNSQLIADVQARIRPDAVPVHSDLAAAEDPVDVTLRHALEDLGEVIVDALAGTVLPHCKPVDSILA